MAVERTQIQLTEKHLTDTRRAIKEELRYIREAKGEALAYSHLCNSLTPSPENKAQARLYTLAVEALHERINSAYQRLGGRLDDFILMGGMNALLPELAEFSHTETAGIVVDLLNE